MIKCPADNILILDENRNKVLDFCESRKTKNTTIYSKIGRNFFIEYMYGSTDIFTVGFQWLYISILKIFYNILLKFNPN